MANKEVFDADRLREWKERKKMFDEEENTTVINLKERYTKEKEDFEARF